MLKGFFKCAACRNRAASPRLAPLAGQLRRIATTARNDDSVSIGEHLHGAFAPLLTKDPQTGGATSDALIDTDTSDLPTVARWTVAPRKRPVTGAMDTSGSTVEALHAALRSHNIRQAWQVYKNMYRAGKYDTLHADDHSTMLGWLTAHTLPSLAAIHAARVLANMRRSGHRLDLRDYHATMLCHLRNNDLRRVAEAFKAIRADGERPDARAFNLLIAAYGQAKDLRGAFRAWEQMKREVPGAQADMDSWAVMIEACGISNRIEEAERLCDQLRAANAFSDRKVYEAIIRAYGVNGDLEKALKVFGELKDGRARENVDLETYDGIILACEAVDDVETAQELWDELREFCREHGRPSQKGTIVPLVTTFNRMLSLYARHGDVGQSEALFKERSMLYPEDLASYQHLVRAYAYREDWQGCVKVYESMVERGFLPDIEIVQVAMRAQSKIR
ncbi:hypothetical protein SpCBS45565_g00136 [Spizellomyces sp. 'palustris']|nr:hypothetical protein SpCBS45565_g00136 [Spizellomyces sp. 'palustris']